MKSTSSKKSRWIKRLTPVTRMGKANEKGLEEVSKAVLERYFHAEGVTAKKVLYALDSQLARLEAISIGSLQVWKRTTPLAFFVIG